MTQLQTEWLCIATSGATIDGREISPTDLEQMAASYNPATYTALIWQEHKRFNGNLGQVISLKAQKAGGQVKLFAKLRPNAHLLELNQQKQKLFTSIEIIPNFAKTGKAYLGGLAVTDSPASLGTTQLHFSANGTSHTKFVMGNKEPLQFSSNIASGKIAQILSKFNCLEYADKRSLFNKLNIENAICYTPKPSQAAFLCAKHAITYQKFNRAV